MATSHKIDLTDVVTGPTGHRVGVAPAGLPALGQRQRTCHSALPTGDDPVPVLVEVNLRDHHGVCHEPCAPCSGWRVARPSPLCIGGWSPRLEQDCGAASETPTMVCVLPLAGIATHGHAQAPCAPYTSGLQSHTV